MSGRFPLSAAKYCEQPYKTRVVFEARVSYRTAQLRRLPHGIDGLNNVPPSPLRVRPHRSQICDTYRTESIVLIIHAPSGEIS